MTDPASQFANGRSPDRPAPLAGGNGGNEWAGRFDGNPLQILPRKDCRPQPEFLQWHHRVVFRSPQAAR